MQNLSTTILKSQKRFLCLLTCVCLFAINLASAIAQVAPAQTTIASPGIQPIYWQQPMLFIPYQVNKLDPVASSIAQVQLMMSRTGANDWTVLQSAKPNVQGFTYHAPEDGGYWFALKHLDAQGQPLGGAGVIPQLQLVIDTQLPRLKLTATSDTANQIAIHYEANDPNLLPQSLIVEARQAGGLWTNVSIGSPDSSQPGRVMGTIRYALPSSTGEIEIRGSIADAAGLRGQSMATVPLSGPSLTLPGTTPNTTQRDSRPDVATTSVPSNSPPQDPFRSNAPPTQDWPANNSLPRESQSLSSQNLTPVTDTPHFDNSNSSETQVARRTPAKFAVDGNQPTSEDSFAPNLLQADSPPNDAPVPLPPTEESSWTSAGRSPGELLLVNARTFDVEYDLQEVGSWGVAKVELWGTQDGGKSWQSFGVDPDNRSPARVTVPSDGTFGFRIVVEGANGVSPTAPQSGQEPELVVSVDLQPPTAELLAAEPGEGNLTDSLRIRWKAADDNLEPRPIGLFYSSFANGPWSTVAAGLENTGSYVWRIERHIPNRFYLKLEARDTAGNTAAFQTPEPLQLNRPQPTGTLRNVRPINGVPTVDAR